MPPADRADILAKLDVGRAALLASVAGLSDAEAVAKPAEGRWSAIDNIEQLAIVEANMLRGIERALPIEGESKPGREFDLFQRVQVRDRKLSAPVQAQPVGRCGTLAAALEQFDQARARTIAFIQTCDRDLRQCPMSHPLLGPATAMEIIYLVAAHPIRHAAQIRELRGQAV
jgi:DinB superfamily